MAARIKVTFSDHFGISKKILVAEDLFDISLISDLPLFIDPFHLFYSKKPEYKELHDGIIEYLVFLRDLSLSLGPNPLSKGIVDAYYRFPEIKQNWLGFTFNGNSGHGLGLKFAQELNLNFHKFFNDFGVETKTRHFEKLTLIATGIGRDTISDFTTNQIINYLAARTEAFAKKHLPENKTRSFTIKKAVFDYEHQAWVPKTYRLPVFNDDFVVLTPRDLLTKDAAWINKPDFIDSFSEVPEAASDAALREQVSRYLQSKIKEFAVRKIRRGTNKVYLSITKETRAKAAAATIQEFPQTVDIYIRLKEERGGQAIVRSQALVERTEGFLDTQFREFAQLVGDQPQPTSYEEAHVRSLYFKECIELKEGYKNMYEGDKPASEEWIQRMFWCETPLRAAPLNLLRPWMVMATPCTSTLPEMLASMVRSMDIPIVRRKPATSITPLMRVPCITETVTARTAFQTV
jgi:hypothetical protein